MSEESSSPARASRESDTREIIAVILLSVVAVLTAWCGFQSAQWSGEMSIGFSQASGTRIAASSADSEARDNRQFDLTIWAAYVEATATGDEQLADYIEERFTPAFAVAFDAWVADGMVEQGPFVREEYVPPGQAEAAELGKRADEQFEAAVVANKIGDNYSLLTVLFALVLFLAAIAQRHQRLWASRALLALAGGIAVTGIVIAATFPIDL